MKSIHTALLGALIAFCVFPAIVVLVFPAVAEMSASEPADPGVRYVQAESRVEVASNGQVVSMRTTPQLSAEVLAEVEANLHKLRFAPPMKDGRAVSGVTFVQQEICVATGPGDHRFAVTMRGNGPSLDQRDPLAYPRDALIDGREGRFKVTFAIDVDGETRLIDITRTAGGKSFDGDFREALEDWVGAMHFRPETLGGQPVATVVSDEVDFALAANPHKAQAATRRGPGEGGDACRFALDGRHRASYRVALNSPFRPLASN